MSNDSFNTAVKSLLSFHATLESKHETIPAVTGHPDGTVAVPSMTNYIYCRLQGDDSKVVRAFNTSVPNNVAELTVDLEIIKDPQGRTIGYTVLGVSKSIQYIVTPTGSVPIANLPPHHRTHEAARTGGGYDMVNVYEEAIVALRGNAQSPNSMKINVSRGSYWINGVRYYFVGGESPTFTADGDSIDVLCIDSTGTLSIIAGTHGSWGGGAGGYGGTGTGTITFPTITAGLVPIAAINVLATMTAIAEINFGLDPRPFIVSPNALSGSGAVNRVAYWTSATVIGSLAVNATATNKFLTQVSSGAPAWNTIAASDLPGLFSGFANPTASVGLSIINGVLTTAMRSDAAPALDQGIAPTWSAAHSFSAAVTFSLRTATRVAYFGAAGLLTDSANLTFDGTNLVVAGDVAAASASITNNTQTDTLKALTKFTLGNVTALPGNTPNAKFHLGTDMNIAIQNVLSVATMGVLNDAPSAYVEFRLLANPLILNSHVSSGRVLIKTATDNGVDALQVTGSLSVSTTATIGSSVFTGTSGALTVAGTAGKTLSLAFTDNYTLTIAGTTSISGTNTGDQTITLTGDVTGSGTGSFATTIAALAVTNAKIANTTIDLTAKVTGILPSANGGTGVNNAGTLTNASNTTITGGGTIALGGFTLTIPATGTAALLATANVFTANQTISNTAPSLVFTDTTASAKSLTIAVDANLADFRESAGAAGSLLQLDLATNVVNLGGALSLLNATAIYFKDSGATNRPIVNVDSSNFTNIFSAGAAIRFINVAASIAIFYVSNAGNVGITATAFGTGFALGLAMVNATRGSAPPTSSVADQFHLFGADAAAGKAWPAFREEGNTTLTQFIMGVNATQGVSTGTGTAKMNGATSRNSVGWITTNDNAGNVIYIPYWTTVTG